MIDSLHLFIVHSNYGHPYTLVELSKCHLPGCLTCNRCLAPQQYSMDWVFRKGALPDPGWGSVRHRIGCQSLLTVGSTRHGSGLYAFLHPLAIGDGPRG